MSYPCICPLCGGEGKRLRKTWVSSDTSSAAFGEALPPSSGGGVEALTLTVCNACDGKGIVWPPGYQGPWEPLEVTCGQG